MSSFNSAVIAERVAATPLGLNNHLEGLGFGGACEGGGDGLREAEGEETIADGALGAGLGMHDDNAGRGQRVGEAVVAVDAGDLFEEVDLAGEVETPGWELDFVSVVRERREFAAECGEEALDQCGGDAFGRAGCAEDAVDFAERESDGRAFGGLPCEFGDDDVDERAFELAAASCEEVFGYERVGDGRGVEVGAALVAVAGVGVDEVTARSGADGCRRKPRGFDEDVFCFCGDHGVEAAHDTG